MELFYLLSILLGAFITTNAQLVVGAIAAIEFAIEIIEGMEVVATVNGNLVLTITGELIEQEGEATLMYFNTEVDSGLVTLYEGTSDDILASFPIEGLSGGFEQNVALGETSAVSGNFGWSQAIQVPNEEWTAVLDGQWSGTVNVDAAGLGFDMSEGGMSGVGAIIEGPGAENLQTDVFWDMEFQDEGSESESEGGVGLP